MRFDPVRRGCTQFQSVHSILPSEVSTLTPGTACNATLDSRKDIARGLPEVCAPTQNTKRDHDTGLLIRTKYTLIHHLLGRTPGIVEGPRGRRRVLHSTRRAVGTAPGPRRRLVQIEL